MYRSFYWQYLVKRWRFFIVVHVLDWNTAHVSVRHNAAAPQNNVPSESSFATKSALFGPKNVCPFQILDLTLIQIDAFKAVPTGSYWQAYNIIWIESFVLQANNLCPEFIELIYWIEFLFFVITNSPFKTQSLSCCDLSPWIHIIGQLKLESMHIRL